MKHIHKILTVLFVGVMASAYGVTCYLPQVVCCTAAGVEIGTLNPAGCGTFSAVLYSDEEAWRFDTYSTSLGGQPGPGTTLAVWCDGTYVLNEYVAAPGSEAYLAPQAGNNAPNQIKEGYGMRIYYNDCMGATITGVNGNSSEITSGDLKTAVYTVTTHYLSATRSTCN